MQAYCNNYMDTLITYKMMNSYMTKIMNTTESEP